MKKRSIDFYCPRWGSEHLHWEDFFIALKLAGYEGTEWAISRETGRRELDEVFELAGRYQIKIIAQHYDTYEADFFIHLDCYACWLEKIKDYPIIRLNSQTGKDFFSFQENKALIDMASDFGRDNRVMVSHETHRNKFSFAAHVTREYLDAIPSLKLSLDASHWVCAAESLLYDQMETMRLATGRTEHIHARVGYPQGPQVSDPRLAEWGEALEAHLAWWDRAVQQQRQRQDPTPITITTEFGPYPYMVRLPGGGDIADQWEINTWMMNFLKDRYA